LNKYAATLRELDPRILVNKRFMQLAKGFVFLADHPSFVIIEHNFDLVFGVRLMVHRIIAYTILLNTAFQPHLEEMGPTVSI
jgi:hypothetical protein